MEYSTWDLQGQFKDFDFYSEVDRKPLDGFEQQSVMIGLIYIYFKTTLLYLEIRLKGTTGRISRKHNNPGESSWCF